VELGLRCIIWRSSDLSLPFSRLYNPFSFAPFSPLFLRFNLIVFFGARNAQQKLEYHKDPVAKWEMAIL